MRYRVSPRIGEILKERGMTQAQLSELTGISQSTISKFDRNIRHQGDHLAAISRALNLTIDDLFIIEEVEEKID